MAHYLSNDFPLSIKAAQHGDYGDHRTNPLPDPSFSHGQS